MAATKTRARSNNGAGPVVAEAARKANKPAVAAAAALAGGLVIGSRPGTGKRGLG